MTSTQTPVFELTPTTAADGLADLATFLNDVKGPATLDASGARRIGTLAVQLILAARRANPEITLVGAKPETLEGLRLLGLESDLVGMED